LIRLNKFLAERGVCARRKADALIAARAVTVDGRVARLGESVDPSRHVVCVRGKRVDPTVSERRTLVLHKPIGVVTTLHDEHGRRSIAALLPSSPRFFPVGRLDVASTGVLLCTTDGELARVLTHPSFGVEKIYRVRASGDMTESTRLALGAMRTRRRADGTWTFDVALREGRNRQVRRMCAQRGLRVLELARVRFGPVEIGSLPAGSTRSLTAAEKRALDTLMRDAARQKRAAVQPTE